MSDEPIRTVAAVILDESERVLLVRKTGSSVFIQPGGKLEPGEAPLDTLRRELREELGVELDEASAVLLGEFEEMAVNEPGRRVRAIVYRCAVRGDAVPATEIAELAWVPARGPFPVEVAPLSARHVLPALLSQAA